MLLAAATSSSHWGHILGWSFIVGAIAGAGVFVLEVCLIATRNSGKTTKLRLRTALDKLSPDWSFKDNWVSSVTIGSSVLAALLTASGLLSTDSASSPPPPAVPMLAVSGAFAAVLVGLGPLVVKIFASGLELPTIGGTLAAAFVTLTGTIGQTVALIWVFHDVAHGATQAALEASGILTAVVILAYALRTLWFYVTLDVTPSNTHNALL